MEEPIERAVKEIQRLAGECLNTVRLLPKNKQNQEAEDRVLLVWRDLRKLADDLRLREL